MKHLFPALLLAATLPVQAAAPISLSSSQDPKDAQARRFEVRLERPATVALTCTQDGNPKEQHRVTREAAGDHAITVRGLLAASRYTCSAEAVDPSSRRTLRSAPVSFITAPLPRDLSAPKITIPSANLPQTGYTLYNYGKLRGFWRLSSNYLVIIDAEGNVRWYLPGPGAGDVDATYLGNDRISYGGAGDVYYPPTIVGLDKQVQFKAANTASSPTENVGSWNHDIGLSTDGDTFFALTYSSNEGSWTGFVLKEIDIATNEVIWTWDSYIDGVQTGMLPSGSSSFSDPFHANAVQDRWEDGRLYLYVNMRTQYQTMKIDYETGEVLWKLGYGGDFTLLEADGSPADDSRWFSNQHDAKLVDNTYVVYDNGTDDRNLLEGTPHSRGIRLELDEDTMTARIAFEWSEANWAEPIWGGHDMLPNGNSLIAIGHCQVCGVPSRKSGLIEVASAGQVVWRADFPVEADTLYRAQRIDGCAIFNNRQYCP